MLDINIPGYRHLRLDHLVLDVNGTLALDGELLEGVQPMLESLQYQLNIHMLTANTHEQQHVIDEALGLKAHIITHGLREKAEYVMSLNADHVVAIGNGANDVWMCEAAALSIGVVGPEGAAGGLVRTTDILVHDIRDGLGLLLNPNRLRATLRR